MINLSDTQRILLAGASQHTDDSVLPLPPSIKPGGGAAKALAVLTRHKLIEERETSSEAAVSRTDGDARFGLFITDAGLVAIGASEGETFVKAAPIYSPESGEAKKAPSKIATVLELLARADGAPVSELIEATGWLPHTIRAAITGLRKKGHSVQRIKRDGLTFYLLGAA